MFIPETDRERQLVDAIKWERDMRLRLEGFTDRVEAENGRLQEEIDRLTNENEVGMEWNCGPN